VQRSIFLLLLLFSALAASASVIITTKTLPNGAVQTPYAATVATSGGCTPMTWKIISGTLPAGVTSTTTNNTRYLALSGTPTATATYSFNVSVTGCGKHVAQAYYSVTIQAQLPVSYTLTVGKAGTGSGTVTSNPAVINCGAACNASFNSGTVVALNPAPNAGSTFTGWGGACSGSGACSVTMSAAKSVTAAFVVPVQHTVDLTWSDSDSSVVGYSIYRGPCPSGPLALVASAIALPAYTDATVVSGETYCYVATATDSTGAESTYSNVAQAIILSP
jgi:hypothetical protein